MKPLTHFRPGSLSLPQLAMTWLSLSVFLGLPLMFLEVLAPELAGEGFPLHVEMGLAVVLLPLGWGLGRWLLGRFAQDPASQTAPLLAAELGLAPTGEVWVGQTKAGAAILHRSGELEYSAPVPRLTEGLSVRSRGGEDLERTGNPIFDHLLQVRGASPHDLETMGEHAEALVEVVHGLGAEISRGQLRATLWLPDSAEALSPLREALVRLDHAASALGQP